MKLSDRSVYDRNFYSSRAALTRHAAKCVLSIVRDALPPISSVVDVGCGVGAWLAEAREGGVSRVRGYDGDWVERDLLVVAPEEFETWDLTKPIVTGERFDLAISMEVAEHLPPELAEGFVVSLMRLSDFILFSAAIPGQGGVNHVNERWQSYWAGLFAEHNYDAYDIVRPAIWNDSAIGFPYRQNCMLFAARARRDEVCAVPVAFVESLSLVHPELYLAVTTKSIRGALRDLTQGLRRRFAGSS